MITDTTEAAGLPLGGVGRRQDARSEQDGEAEEELPDQTEIIVTKRAVLVCRPGHTHVQAEWGTEYIAPQPAKNRDGLRLLEAVR